MRRAFNKYGSIEIEDSILKYRISIQELNSDDTLEFEKGIKRKLQTVINANSFLLPFDIQVVNRYMMFYYDLSHFASIDYLRELELDEKIPFYLSLIELAKEHEKGTKISWDRANFICDKYEQDVKVFLFETDNLKVYESPIDLMKTVKDLIVSTMTTLSVVMHLPKRQDFINPSEENINFVENIYKLQNLDDLYMYLETISLDLEQAASLHEDEPDSKKKKARSLFKPIEKKEKIEKPKEKKEKVKTKKAPSSKKAKGNVNKKNVKNANDRKMPGKLILLVGAALILYIISNVILSPNDSENGSLMTEKVGTNESSFFNNSQKYGNNLVWAYRKAHNSDYEEALGFLSNIRKSDLDKGDIPLLIEVYDKNEQLSELLTEVPTLANDVITYLLTENKIEEVVTVSNGMESKNPYIEFEKAYINQEFEYMLSLVDKIEINGRKETQIIDGYLALEKYDEAKNFAEKVGNPDLIKKVQEYSK